MSDPIARETAKPRGLLDRAWALVPLAAFLLVLGVGAIALMQGGARREEVEGLVGQPAPRFALESLDGQTAITNETFAGRPYVINFFASWCAPCRVEHPLLGPLSAGAPLLGVAYKDEPPDARGYLNELGDPYAAKALDPEGRIGLEFGITGVPETYVIGADGTIVAIFRGPLTPEALDAKILPALKRAERR